MIALLFLGDTTNLKLDRYIAGLFVVGMVTLDEAGEVVAA